MTFFEARPQPPSDLARALAVLPLLLVLVAPGAAAEGDDGPALRKLASGAVAVALHGDMLVWAQDLHGRVDLVATDLRSGAPRLLTSLPGATGGGLRGLASDGGVVAWIDDRSGTTDAWMLDLASGRQARLSESAGLETSLAVADGHVAWAGTDGLFVHAVGNGSTWRVGSTTADAAALGPLGVAWASVEGPARTLELAAHDGGGQRRLDGGDRDLVQKVCMTGDVIAWHVQSMPGSRDDVQRYQVRLQTQGRVVNLTDPLPQSVAGPWGGAGRIAWGQVLDGEAALIVLEPDETRTVLHVAPAGVGLAADRLVVLSQDGDVLLMTPSAGPANGAPWTAAPILAAVLWALAAWRRSRP